MFGEGLLTPPKRLTEGLPGEGRPTVGRVARSETGHNRDRPQQGSTLFRFGLG